jgi:hypothetical protein
VSFFFYENSVQRLLTVVTSRLDTVRRQQNGEAGTADAATAQNQVVEARARYIESLHKAADAVSRERERLEFWSDAHQTTGKAPAPIKKGATPAPSPPVPPKEDLLDESTLSPRDSHSDITARVDELPGGWVDGADERHEHDDQPAAEAVREMPAEAPAAGEDEDEAAVAV